MKILHVITTINRGGAENHLAQLISLQIASGHSVSVAYLKGDAWWAAHFNRLGVSLYSLMMSFYGSFMPFLRLIRILFVERPDVLHAHLRPAQLYSFFSVIFFPKVRLVFTEHNDIPFCKFRVLEISRHLLYLRAHAVICISQSVYDFLSNFSRLPVSKRIVVSYAIDTTPYENVSAADIIQQRSVWSNEPSDIIFGTVSRMVRQKRLDLLLSAYALFVQRNKQYNSKLVIVGDGILKNYVSKLIVDFHLEDKVVIENYRSDIPLVMKSFDVFLLSSQWEGFGLVLLEAMAAGKPVVAHAVSAIPETVIDGQTGICVPFGNTELFCRALEFFISSTNRQAYGENSRIHLLKTFSTSKMYQQTIEAYENSKPA